LALEALEERAVPATFTVVNGDDDGAGSLRAAIAAAKDETTYPGHDDVEFAAGVAAVTLTTGQLTLTSDVSITGPNTGVTVSGGGASRVFNVTAGVTASISGMTITGGNSGDFDSGGGVFNEGTLTLTDCTVSGNTTGTFGGGGGVCNRGTLTM